MFVIICLPNICNFEYTEMRIQHTVEDSSGLSDYFELTLVVGYQDRLGYFKIS